jgi:multiple sugar transport system permease protein
VKVPPTFLPESFSNFTNYSGVFERMQFGRMLLNSTILVLVVIFVTLFLSSLAGYGFAKFSFRMKELSFILIVGVLMVPFQSLAVPLFRMMVRFKLVDTFLGLSIPLLVSAFGVLLMRTYISTIPNDYIDAARTYGAGELMIFFRLILPMSKGGLAALGLIKFTWTWNEFFWPLLVCISEQKYVVTLGLSQLTNMYFTEYHLITAAAIMSIMPMFLLFTFFNKWMMQSLAGGIKG